MTGVNYTYFCGCITAIRHSKCPDCSTHLITEASVDFKEIKLKKVLVSRTFSKVVDSLPKKTDFILIRGKLTDKRLKLYKKIHKAFPNTIFVYQSFTVSSSSQVLSYFMRAGYTQISLMSDLTSTKNIRVKGVDCAEIEVGRLYLFNAGIIDKSDLLKSPINLHTDYVKDLLEYFKPKFAVSINDSNGVLFDACESLKIKSLTHTIYPSLSQRIRRGYPDFKPNRSKLV